MCKMSHSHRLVNFHSWLDTCLYLVSHVCTMIFPVASTNTLTVVTNPTDTGFPDNQLAVPVGSNQVLRCVGSGTSSPPSVVWVRNGEQVVNGGRITITEETTSIGQQRSNDLQITNFALSDAGVYQCIFTEGSEVITTTPLRLDTGWCTLIRHY